jgi:ketosteroid isomerase-like protein
VSRENVELIRRQIGDVDLVEVIRSDELWAERLAEIDEGFEEDFEFVVTVPGEPVVGHGFAEWREQFLEWTGPWESYEPKIEEIIDLGDRVVVLGTDSGRMKDMNRRVQTTGLVLYRFAGGRVARVEYYFDRQEGLRAAGLAA